MCPRRETPAGAYKICAFSAEKDGCPFDLQVRFVRILL